MTKRDLEDHKCKKKSVLFAKNENSILKCFGTALFLIVIFRLKLRLSCPTLVMGIVKHSRNVTFRVLLST